MRQLVRVSVSVSVLSFADECKKCGSACVRVSVCEIERERERGAKRDNNSE